MKSIVIFIIPLVVGRIYSLIVNLYGLPSTDMLLPISRGFLSDLAIGAAAGFALQRLYRRKFAYYPAWVLWVLAISLNAEHITVNAANANHSFIHLALTEEFILGSVFSFKSLYTFLVCLGFSVPFSLAYSRYSPIRTKNIVQFAVISLFVLCVIFIPASRLYPYWMQMNLIEENAKNLLYNQNYYFTDTAVDKAILQKFVDQDLSGKPIVQYPDKKPNVLLIMVEGLGYDTVKSGKVPALKKLSERNLSYENFIGLQRQTNRGVYSLICGDYPNFLTKEAKSDYVGMYGSLKKCLPEVLGLNGYHTVFMQSADLGYMKKDLFAEAAGFDEIIGSNDYKEFYSKRRWGVDDRTLYVNAYKKIEKLASGPKPWFLTLLTSGTHHPYNIPGISVPTPAQALTYADDSLEEFLDDLSSSGVFKDTLVIITSDESLFSPEKGMLGELGGNHLPMVVLSPEIPGAMAQKEVFTQADILLSIVDYLNLAPREHTGRSIFRTYKDARNFIFGNVYSAKIYSYSHDGKIYICSKDFDCSSYKSANNLPFDSSYASTNADYAFISEVKHFLAYNELNSDKLNTNYIYYKNRSQYVGSRFLVGDQKLSVSAGDIIRWRYKIKAKAPLNISLYALIVTDSLDNAEPIFQETVSVEKGETCKLQVLTTENGKYTVEGLTIERLKRASQ
jgi:phosphoglycerol transferase MdoB-like AlkP superfamily enzyme